MSVVAFNFTTWTARYPEFAAVDPTLAGLFWAEAGIYCDNTDASPVPTVAEGGTRDVLLYALESHIAWLAGQGAGNPGSPIVGRISDATQGSVSVTATLEGESEQRAFFSQSRYGLSFWNTSRLYRTSLYVPPSGPLMTGPGRNPWDPTA